MKNYPSSCILLAALVTIVCTSVFAAERPNIVVFLCDDLGYGDLECYGHPHIKTPHLNKLAAEGIRFTDCYSTAPVCSPSRVGLLTGRSPNRAGVYDWIPPGNKPRPDAREQVHLRRSETTIAQLLKDAGYATCVSGKWHCNAQFNAASQPQPGDAGFDHWMATQNNAAPSHRNPVNYVRNGKPVGKLEGYSCNLAVAEAERWLEALTKADPEQPFFLFVPFHEPHEPVASPEDLVAQYRDVAKSEKQAEYFANVANVDRAVGSLMAKLKALDRDQNTLVIFTSDNGPETLSRYIRADRSFGVATPLRGMKLWTTDAGFRVAGIMRWPKGIMPGQTVNTPVSALDFLPTFAALGEAKVPDALALDGMDVRALLSGDEITREKPLFWVFFNAINEQRVAMRDGDFKVLAKVDLPKMQNVHAGVAEKVRNATLSEVAIFNIREDIDESENLAGKDAAQTKAFTEKLTKMYRELTADSHVWTPVGK